MPRFSITRAGIVLVIVASCLLGMTGRVAYLQSYGRQNTLRWAERQQHTSMSLEARRGSIWDRNGLAMAATVQTTSLYVDPAFMLQQYQGEKRNLNQMDQDLRKLCSLVDCSLDDLLSLISENPDSRYLRIAANLDEPLRDEIEKMKIPGVGFEPVCERWYPMGAIASHVLGSVGRDGVGLEGLELKYQQLLAGRKGFKRIEKDARCRPIGVDADDYSPPAHGQHLVLTIDANIQMLAEEELFRTCSEFSARYGEVVVMDPKTAEILALANYPTFNPQKLEDSRPEDRLNRAVVVPYEPGSTIKPFIVGPALAWHITRPSEVWPVNGSSYNPYGDRHVTDVHPYYNLCTWDVLVKSSNIGMTMLAERMGNPALFRALSSFGFGQRSGIDLPGEHPGQLHPLKAWKRDATVSVAQGYYMMVTPLQLARAFAVYANGGRLVQPKLVKGMVDPEGNVVAREPATKLDAWPQVLDEQSAAQIRQILCDVVVRGTAAKKGSKFWNIFGKTGTAHISRGRSGYASDLFNSSFISAAPAEDPRIVVVMVIHEPDRKLGHFGGTVSAPAAVRLIDRTLAYLQVPPSPPLPPPPAEVVPHLYGYTSQSQVTRAE